MKRLILMISIMSILAGVTAFETVPIAEDVTKVETVKQDLPEGTYLVSEQTVIGEQVNHVIASNTIQSNLMNRGESAYPKSEGSKAGLKTITKKNHPNQRLDLHYDPGSCQNKYIGINKTIF